MLEDKVQVDVTDEYIAGFIQAENTFLYQLIFNTKTRKVEPLTPYPDGVHPDDLGYAGKYEDPKVFKYFYVPLVFSISTSIKI